MHQFHGTFLNPVSVWDNSDVETLIALPSASIPSSQTHRSVLFQEFDLRADEPFVAIPERPIDHVIFANDRECRPALENCFPVMVYEEKDTFLESFTIPFLEFQLRPTLGFERLSAQWLEELSLPSDETFLRLHFEPGVAATFELMATFTPIDEVFFPSAVRGIAGEEFPPTPGDTAKNEKTCDIEPLPRCLAANTQYFSENDIRQFAGLFPSLDVRSVQLKGGVLMRMGTTLIVIGDMSGDGLNEANLIDCCVKFDKILVVSVAMPPFVAVEKIKWRCIMSLRQLSAAILPFLVQ
jgi:hypothetical protein